MLKLGELVAYLKADDSDLERGLDRGEHRFDQFGRHVNDVVDHAAVAAGAAGDRGGDLFAAGLWRDRSGRLHDALGRFVSEAGVAGGQAGGALGRGLSGAFDKLSLSNLPIMGLVKLVLALAAAALFAGPAVFLLGGALGSIPALAGGAGLAIATLLIGFTGIGEAFKKTAASGGSAVDRTYQVALATRNLTLATREAVEASEAISRAREDELERLEDLTRAQARASNDQKRATRGVEDAEKALRKARAGGNGDKIGEAEEALEAAKLDLADVKDRVEDLGKERAKADRDGVDGSDQVQAALRRQEQAAYAVVDAQHALGQAQKGTGAGAAAQVTQLSASAQRTVDVIKGLKDEWVDLRLSTQEHLFTGVPGEIQATSKAWFQPLKDELGKYADTYNGIFKTGAASVRQPEFIANTIIGLESVRGLLSRVGGAIAGPGVRAWGQLSAAAKPFIDMLGTKFSTMIVNFSNWIDKAEKSGALSEFFKESAFYLGQIWDIGGETIKVLGQLFAIWTGSENRNADDSALQGIKVGLQDFSDWLDDPKNQEKVRGFIDTIHSAFDVTIDVFKWLKDTGIPTAKDWINTVDGWIDTVGGWIDSAKIWKDATVGAIDDIGASIDGLKERVKRNAAGLFAPIRDEVKDALNFVIDGWNRLTFTIPGVDIPFLGRVGGAAVGVGRIPRLAAGGTMLRAGLAHIAEHGAEGITMPLPAGAQVQPLTPGWRNQGQTGGGLYGEILIRGDGLLAGLRETVAIRGGRVEAVVGA